MKGMQASISIRAQLGINMKSPVCVYGLCNELGITVRFNDINMEGMYDGGSIPRIHVSILRPAARRAFTCAHELGHHIFGHGSTIDELKDELSQSPHSTRPPNELVADAFAAFLLMPTLGIREAFARRSLDPNTASAAEIYSVACNFGVGQSTLVNHLTYALGVIKFDRRALLGRITPKMIRTELLGEIVSEPLTIADEFWSSPTLDAEVGSLLLMPAGVVVDTAMLIPDKNLSSGRLFRTVKPGITRVAIPGTAWSTHVRVAQRKFVGLANYRHLEETEDE